MSIRRFLAFIMLLFFAAGVMAFTNSWHEDVATSVPSKNVLPALQGDRWKEGDIVLRRGKSLISQLLRRMSLHDQTFSHAGILFKESGKWKVLHAIGGEGSKVDGIRSDDIETYCSVNETDTVAFFRVIGEPKLGQRIVRSALALRMDCTGFDTDFDLTTDDKLYCTEFVRKAIQNASHDRISLPLTVASGIHYISCENIYSNRYVQPIYSFSSYVRQTSNR